MWGLWPHDATGHMTSVHKRIHSFKVKPAMTDAGGTAPNRDAEAAERNI